jgi:hypothetical protein
MPAIEYLCTGESLGNERKGLQVAEMTERSEHSNPCALSDIAGTRLRQFINNRCPDSREGS